MAEGKFIISAQNKIKEGLDGAKRDLLGFEDAAKKVGDTLKTALTVTAIAAGLKKLGDAAFDCFKEFGEGERRLNTLKIALNNNAISVQNATSLIEKMARQSLASKDDIEGLVAELASLGKSDKDIEAITTAAVNLSNVTGKDLNSAFTLINATYAGTTGRLTQLLPEIGNLTKEQLAAGEATKLINEKFSALSSQLASSDIPQKLKSIADGWGDLKESIGAQVAPLFNPLLDGINSIITAWNSASRAAEAHRQLLSASGWTQKIALNQEIIDANRPRLDDLQAKQTAYGKSVGWNETMLRQSPQYQAWQAEINDLIAENIKAQNAINYYTEQLKKTPVSLLNPIDKVALIRNGGTSGTGGSSGSGGDKFAPIREGPYSAAGYKLGKTLYDLDKSLDPILKLSPELQKAQSAAIETASNYRADMAAWKDSAELSDEMAAMWGESLDRMAAEYKSNPGVFGQSGITPTGYAQGRADYQVQLLDELQGIFASPQFGQSAITPEGIGAMRTIAEQMDELAKTANPITDEEATAYASTIVDIMGTPSEQGAEFANAVKQGLIDWQLEQLQAQYTTPQQRLTPDGFTAGRDDFAEQILDGLQELYKTPQKRLAPTQYEGQGAQLSIAQQMAKLAKIANPLSEEDARAYADVMVDIMGTPNEQGKELADAYKSGMANWKLDLLQAEFTTPQVRQNPAGMSNANTIDQQIFDMSLLGDITAGMADAFDTATSGLGDFGAAMSGPMSELMAAICPFANMLSGMNPLLAVLIPIIEGLVSVTAPALNAVLKPLFATLQQMGIVIGQALLPIFDALAPVILMIAQILQTLFIPIMQFLSPIMQAFAIMLQPLGPALGALAKAVTILMSPVEWLADLFSYVGEVLKVFAWNIAHPFQQKAGPGEFTSDAFSSLAARLAAIDAMMVNSQSLQGGITTPAFGAGWDASASTASQSASYRTQQITINIYQQAPVVGSGGMAEFVQMIRGQFAELAYYGA